MCQNTSSEPALVQTLIFTHRSSVNVFSPSVLILLSIVFTGMHVVIYLCLQLLLCGQNYVNTGNYSGNTYFCMSKLMYEPT